MNSYFYSYLLKTELFGIELLDSSNLLELMIRFAFNIVVLVILVRCLYYNITKRKDYLFTYILIGTTVFLLCFLLDNVKLQLGFALGLFAIFGIIRYRTMQIEIKEMTYLFMVIGISVINALANKKISYAELIFTNFTLIAVTYGLEKLWLLKHETSREIIYENIDLIKPEKRKELIEDLEKRTGQKISRVEIGKINFMKETARIRFFYFENNNKCL